MTFMKNLSCLLTFLMFLIVSSETKAQTSGDIQGTWRLVSSIIKNEKGEEIIKMDSSTHNLTKIITANRVTFTIYNKKTDSLEVTGQGKATSQDNQYIETFEQSTS